MLEILCNIGAVWKKKRSWLSKLRDEFKMLCMVVPFVKTIFGQSLDRTQPFKTLVVRHLFS
jgi:hypothetical protein